MIPPFDNETGYLPIGEHKADWDEFAKRFGFNRRRRKMLEGLLEALRNLRDAGCRVAIIDGSFVTQKPHPADYDGIWEPRSVDLALVDRVLLTFDDRRAAMKAKYAGELFPASFFAAPGVRFREFFQFDREGRRKGTVRLALRSLP
jgi:hypothetical protein